MRFNKLQNKIDKSMELDEHIEKLAQRYNLKKKPPVFIGKEAIKYAKKHVKGFKVSCFLYGGFISKDVEERYVETGVICLFKKKLNIGTLAHEMYHSKQYQDDRSVFKRDRRIEKIKYKLLYIYVRTEREAFDQGLFYLLSEKYYFSALKYYLKLSFNYAAPFLFVYFIAIIFFFIKNFIVI